jgi:hypothetical protein
MITGMTHALKKAQEQRDSPLYKAIYDMLSTLLANSILVDFTSNFFVRTLLGLPISLKPQMCYVLYYV